jgi:hypothetical protein
MNVYKRENFPKRTHFYKSANVPDSVNVQKTDFPIGVRGVIIYAKKTWV